MNNFCLYPPPVFRCFWKDPLMTPTTPLQASFTATPPPHPPPLPPLKILIIHEQDGHSRVGLARLSAQSVEPLGKVHRPGETLVSPAGSHNPVGAVSFVQTVLVADWPFFGKSHRGDRPPAWPRPGISFFFIDLSYL